MTYRMTLMAATAGTLFAASTAFAGPEIVQGPASIRPVLLHGMTVQNTCNGMRAKGRFVSPW